MKKTLIYSDWQKQDELLAYLRILTALTKRNIQVRYKQSILGFFWSLLNPLIFFSIFILLFSRVFVEIENYPLFVLIGVLYWNFFSNTTSQMLRSIIDSGNLIKSIPIPAITYPISIAIASLVNFGMALVPFVLFFAFLGGKLFWGSIWVIPLSMIFTVLIIGWSLVLATLNVYFRDTEMLWNTLTPALLYLTPVAYPSTMVPEQYRWIVQCNPLHFFIQAFRGVLYYQRVPDIHLCLLLIAIAFFSLSLGIIVFNKLKDGFISIL